MGVVPNLLHWCVDLVSNTCSQLPNRLQPLNLQQLKLSRSLLGDVHHLDQQVRLTVLAGDDRNSFMGPYDSPIARFERSFITNIRLACNA